MTGAIALAVLSVCGAAVLTNAPRPSASLVSRSNWVLATALPPREDFPTDWDYAVSGSVGRATPPDPASASSDRAARYAPPACEDIPGILAGPGTYVANVRVDRDPDPWWIAKAVPADAAATGETDEHGPTASFVIRAVGDGRALIGDYLRWLRRCRSYRVTVADPLTGGIHDRGVITVVERRPSGRADSAIAVTRSFVAVGENHAPSFTYRASYYAVRGLLLECSTNMEGADADLAAQLAAQTLQRLRAL